jgi:hypothetical protein
MRRTNDRAAWTSAILGKPEKKPSKYGNKKTDGFDSKREAKVAKDLMSLERAGNIRNLEMQVPIVLIEGRGGVKSITYVADFTYEDPDGTKHIMDAKGMRTDVYKLKKKMLFLLHGLTIEEV